MRAVRRVFGRGAFQPGAGDDDEPRFELRLDTTTRLVRAMGLLGGTSMARSPTLSRRPFPLIRGRLAMPAEAAK